MKFITWKLDPQLHRMGISLDGQNCPEMEKENQITINYSCYEKKQF